MSQRIIDWAGLAGIAVTLVAMCLLGQGLEPAWADSGDSHAKIIKVKKDKPGKPDKDDKVHGNGPPPWAPAHGYRAKHQYQYWPQSEVYFDEERNVWFYNVDKYVDYYNPPEGQSGWVQNQELPDEIRLRMNIGDFVDIEMDAPNPFDFHQDVHSWYPGF